MYFKIAFLCETLPALDALVGFLRCMDGDVYAKVFPAFEFFAAKCAPKYSGILTMLHSNVRSNGKFVEVRFATPWKTAW